jgi:hypothetical protein
MYLDLFRIDWQEVGVLSLSDEIARLQSCLQESQHLRDYLQQYYKLLQDREMELSREKGKSSNNGLG